MLKVAHPKELHSGKNKHTSLKLIAGENTLAYFTPVNIKKYEKTLKC
jgi:hypothetical protein